MGCFIDCLFEGVGQVVLVEHGVAHLQQRGKTLLSLSKRVDYNQVVVVERA